MASLTDLREVVDVVIGVDPHAWDLARTRAELGGKVCLWGGVNGHLTVEQGTVAQVEAEVGGLPAREGHGHSSQPRRSRRLQRRH